MFSSRNREPATAPAAAPANQQQKRPLRSSSAPSIISADLVVQGTLTSTGDIQIDGKVEGNVRSDGLVIGDKACIEGDVVAEDVTVRGRVRGSIRARKILLAATCHVEGDILHETFAVETGAFFEGNCRHSDNPLAGEARSSNSSYPASVAATPNKPLPVAPLGQGSRPADAALRPGGAAPGSIAASN
jgi:cytoskeletal protein CcmA (bactofilin family)